MLVIRCTGTLACLGVAVFSGWEAYLIHYWNTPPKNLLFSGPVYVFGVTMSANAGIAGLGVLSIAFLCLAAYVLFGFGSNN